MEGEPVEGESPFAPEQIRLIVENQLQDNEPEETGRTLARLMAAGYGRTEAVDKIGKVVVAELLDVLESRQPFDKRRFTDRLRALE